VIAVGALTVAACLGIAVAIGDGVLSRLDGLLLVLFWIASALALRRWQRGAEPVSDEKTGTGLGRGLTSLTAWLAVVAGAAMLVVRSFVELTDAIGIPELIASTVVLALGTSFPELVVDFTAIRRGASALAFGEIFGSSLVDASLAIGIGPMFRATDVSGTAGTSVLVVAAGIAAATAIWHRRRTSDTQVAVGLFTVYILCVAAMITWASG